MFVEIAASVAAGFIASGVSWFVSLSPRLARIEEKHDALRDLLDAKFEASDKLWDHRLTRLERAMNGALKHGD